MKALILAGGKATRLLPITAEVPKCLLPIRDKPILGWQLEALAAHGITDVVFLTGMHAEQIRAYMHDAHSAISCTYIHNARFADTRPAYALWLARDVLCVEDVLYLNGDALFETHALTLVLEDPHPNVTAIRRHPWDEEQVNVIMDGDRVVEIGKHITEQQNHGEFVGITKLSKAFGAGIVQALDGTPEAIRDTMFAVDAIQAAIASGHELYATDITDVKASEIDTANDYNDARALWHDR